MPLRKRIFKAAPPKRSQLEIRWTTTRFSWRSWSAKLAKKPQELR